MMSAKFWDLGSSSTCHAAPLPLISSLDLSAFPWTYRIYQLTKVLNQHCCQSACFGLLGSESSTGEEVRGSCGYILKIGRCCSAVVISSRLRLHLVTWYCFKNLSIKVLCNPVASGLWCTAREGDYESQIWVLASVSQIQSSFCLFYLTMLDKKANMCFVKLPKSTPCEWWPLIWLPGATYHHAFCQAEP